MRSATELPWLKIHEFLLDVGSARQPKELCVQVIKRIQTLVPYDQARVYFVNDSGKVYDQVLAGVDPTWSDVYLEYYSQVEGGRYSIPNRMENPLSKLEWGVYDWASYEGDQFIAEYIRPQRLRYSAGFALHDADGLMKGTYVLDRTGHSGYTQAEIDMLCLIQPHLDNLHRNLFVVASEEKRIQNAEIREALTRRELQIAELLAKGLTPTRISRSLCLSLSTVYRHIANIHAKLKVSNRQELLLKLIG